MRVLDHVLVGGVEHILARQVVRVIAGNVVFGHQAGDGLYAVVRKGVAGGEVHIELLREAAVAQVERVVLLAVQVRIAPADGRRVAVVQIRVQVPDARTVNTHIIPHAHVGEVAHFPPHRCRGDHVVKVLAEVLAPSQQILDVLYRMFIAHAQPCRQLFPAQAVAQVSGYDVVHVAVVRAVFLVKDIVGVCKRFRKSAQSVCKSSSSWYSE